MDVRNGLLGSSASASSEMLQAVWQMALPLSSSATLAPDLWAAEPRAIQLSAESLDHACMHAILVAIALPLMLAGVRSCVGPYKVEFASESSITLNSLI
jgi:hypothetical protein